jgi:hypothetical protein
MACSAIAYPLHPRNQCSKGEDDEADKQCRNDWPAFLCVPFLRQDKLCVFVVPLIICHFSYGSIT